MGQDYVAPLGWHDTASTSVLDGVWCGPCQATHTMGILDMGGLAPLLVRKTSKKKKSEN
jgi:hypothetical protein